MKTMYPQNGIKGGKGDGGSKKASEAAEKSYQLQLAQFELEKEMLAKQEQLTNEEELQKRIAAEQSIANKASGAKSTILTDSSSLLKPTISTKSLYK